MTTINLQFALSIVCAVLLLSGGCKGSDGSNPPRTPNQSTDGTDSGRANDDDTVDDAPADPPSPPPPPADPDAILWRGPAFSLDVLVMESFPEQYAVVWKVVARAGGHNLRLDRAEWAGDRLNIYVTFEMPGPDEVVTMALVPFEQRFDAGTMKVGSARLFVRGITRGTDNSKADWVLAAKVN
jgi:hypothetical protein